MIEDHELLRRYAEEKSQDAFAELVRRRIGLVYSVAVRQCGGDAHLAEDVAQKVFADLARKAPSLVDRPVLSGWLYRSTQFAASDVVRSERRRRAREEATHVMNETNAGAGASAGDWEKFRPVIDEAMGELDEEDRDAVALRFFEGRAFAEIGRALRLSEDTARKRVERALDKLHAVLARRGVTSTTAALGLALANQVAVAAPAGLAANVASGAMATVGAGAAGWALSGALASTKVMLGGLGAVAALATAVAVYERGEAAAARAAVAEAAKQEQAVRGEVVALQRQVRESAARVRAAEEDTAQLLAAIQALPRPGPGGRGAAAVALTAGETKAEESDGVVTKEAVDARYRRAQQLAREGNWAAALPELLWCYDVGMVRVSSYTGVRTSFLLSELGKLARDYPAAAVALQQRRDAAEAKLLAAAGDRRDAMEVASLNATLGDHARNVALYDKLPAGDARREGMGYRVFEPLVAAQRYADALGARPFREMGVQFERAIEERPLPATIRDAEAVRRSQRSFAVTSTATSIEVLAGAGDLANARVLLGRLLAYDNSEATRATLATQLKRAGHPELLAGAGAR